MSCADAPPDVAMAVHLSCEVVSVGGCARSVTLPAAPAGAAAGMDSFESISFYVLSFVKNLPGVKDLEYHEFPSAEQSDFQQWQVCGKPIPSFGLRLNNSSRSASTSAVPPLCCLRRHHHPTHHTPSTTHPQPPCE